MPLGAEDASHVAQMNLPWESRETTLVTSGSCRETGCRAGQVMAAIAGNWKQWSMGPPDISSGNDWPSWGATERRLFVLKAQVTFASGAPDPPVSPGFGAPFMAVWEGSSLFPTSTQRASLFGHSTRSLHLSWAHLSHPRCPGASFHTAWVWTSRLSWQCCGTGQTFPESCRFTRQTSCLVASSAWNLVYLGDSPWLLHLVSGWIKCSSVRYACFSGHSLQPEPLFYFLFLK